MDNTCIFSFTVAKNEAVYRSFTSQPGRSINGGKFPRGRGALNYAYFSITITIR